MITDDFQSLEVGEVIDLYTLDLGPLGGGQYTFTPSVDVEDGEVSFGGVKYTPVDMIVDGFEVTGRGVLPRPTLKITNVHRVITALVLKFDDLVGARITRIRTLGKYLDEGAEPDPTAHFPIDKWVIAQKSAMTKLYVEFTLSASIDVEGQKLPQRLVPHDYCKRRYRIYDQPKAEFRYENAQCPYTGNNYFKRDGTPTVHAYEDVCPKTLKGCTLRFGHDRLPGWFFPGAGRYQRGN